MKALLQRVAHARVTVSGEEVGSIGPGLLVYLACERGDGEEQARRLGARIARYRVFPDDAGRSNLDVRASGGSVLLVPQFTLAADTRKGNRPSFTTAAEPAHARALLDVVAAALAAEGPKVARGAFGAAMEVASVNAGPATYLLEAGPAGT